MTTNVGTLDRVLRIVAGLILIALVFVGPQSPWGWLGVILVATAFVGFCPIYKVLGLCTTRKAGT